MGWENVPVEIFGIPQSTITNFNIITNPRGYQGTGVSVNYKLATQCNILNNVYVWGDSSGLSLRSYTSSYPNRYQLLGFNNGSYYDNLQIAGEIYNTSEVTFVCAVDHSAQKGFLGFILKSGNSWVWCSPTTPPTNGNTYQYTLITNNIVVQYNWQSVPSISSKNGILSDNSFWNSDSPMLLSTIDAEQLANLDVDTPVTGLTEGFSIKSPSLSAPFSSFRNKWLRLSNDNYATIGMFAYGMSGNRFEFSFFKDVEGVTTVVFQCTINVGIGDGNPYLGFIVDNENEAAKLNIIFVKESYDSETGLTNNYVDFNTISMSAQEMSGLYDWLNGSWSEETDPDESEENIPQGNDDNDPVVNNPLDSLENPTYGALGSGFIKLYKMTPSQLASLADYMWDANFLENLVRLFSDPRELIVGLSVFPLSPTNTTPATVRAGNLSTGVSGELLNSEYRTRYAGSVKVPKGKSNFMSFGPFRRVRIFVPYCGEHELDPSAIYGKTLKLYYHLSFFSGTCVAELKRNDEPFMFFGGQIGFQVPISSVDYTRTISSILSAGASIGSAIMTGGGSLLFGGASEVTEDDEKKKKEKEPASGSQVSRIVNSLAKGFSPNVTYNSAGGSTTGFLGCQQPFLIFEESIPAFDGEQSDFLGSVQKKVKTLSECEGYTKVLEVHLEGIGCTDTEQNDIKRQLMSGVIIRNGSSTPSASSNQLVLLKNLSENNVIGKTWDNTTRVVTWQNLHDQSIYSPSFFIDGDCTGFNYVYIPLFNRFYFIVDYKLTKSSLQELRLQVDSLQSFKDDILNCKAVIDRGTGKNNAFIEDPYKWTQANKEVSTVPFTNSGFPVNFDHQEDCYILAIASGNN